MSSFWVSVAVARRGDDKLVVGKAIADMPRGLLAPKNIADPRIDLRNHWLAGIVYLYDSSDGVLQPALIVDRDGDVDWINSAFRTEHQYDWILSAAISAANEYIMGLDLQGQPQAS